MSVVSWPRAVARDDVPTEEVARLTVGGRLQRSGWRYFAWFVVASIGAVYAWAARHEMNPDGISYLDVATAYLRGDWSMAFNRLWSPLYPMLMAMTMWASKPTSFQEFATVHYLNFAIFLGALASFEFLLTQLIRYHRTLAAKAARGGRVVLPEWGLRTVGYAVFAYSSFELISIPGVTPDMSVAACVYLAAGLLVTIHLRPGRTMPFLLLGVVLGLGYLAKAPMFLLAFVFLALAAAAAYTQRPPVSALRRLMVAIIPFVLITGSLVVAFFATGQGVTLGESGRLNYAWHVDGLPYVHWQGEFPGSGRPLHPTREILSSPPVYEFATPVHGTYSPWDDPAYWYQGVAVHVDLRGHVRNVIRSAKVLLAMLLGPQLSLVVYGLVLLYLGRRGRWFLHDALPYSFLFLPALVAVGMFSLVWIEPRFIAPFVTLFWLGVFASLTVADFPGAQRVIKAVTAAMVAMLIVPTSYATLGTMKALLARQNAPPQFAVARGLQQLGIQPGDPLAVIRDSSGASDEYWARLSGVRIISELPACRAYAGSACDREHMEGVSAFVRADGETRDRILRIFAQTGAKAVVMMNENYTPLQGWRRISDTNYYVYLPGDVDPRGHARTGKQ